MTVDYHDQVYGTTDNHKPMGWSNGVDADQPLTLVDNHATAYQILNADTRNVLTVDTSGDNITFGNSTDAYTFDFTGDCSWTVPDQSNAFVLDAAGGEEYININTTASSEAMVLGNTTTYPDITNYSDLFMLQSSGAGLYQSKTVAGQTTDAAARDMATISTTTDEAGFIKVTAVGAQNDSGTMVSAAFYKVFRYENDSGTVTVVTTSSAITDDTDGASSGWTVTAAASGTNVIVRFTGSAGDTVNWVGHVEWMSASG